MNTKRANLWDTETQTFTHLHAQDELQDTCVCVFVSLMQFKKKSTSLPRELSAIADLNPLRYVSAASSFWTAVAAVTKQVHFLFSGANWEPQQSALRPFWMHSTQGFYRNGTHVNTDLPQYHATEQEGGGAYIYIYIYIYNHSKREWLFFIPFLPCLWCRWAKIALQNSFCYSFIFRYKYINI